MSATARCVRVAASTGTRVLVFGSAAGGTLLRVGLRRKESL